MCWYITRQTVRYLTSLPTRHHLVSHFNANTGHLLLPGHCDKNLFKVERSIGDVIMIDFPEPVHQAYLIHCALYSLVVRMSFLVERVVGLLELNSSQHIRKHKNCKNF